MGHEILMPLKPKVNHKNVPRCRGSLKYKRKFEIEKKSKMCHLDKKLNKNVPSHWFFSSSETREHLNFRLRENKTVKDGGIVTELLKQTIESNLNEYRTLQ